MKRDLDWRQAPPSARPSPRARSPPSRVTLPAPRARLRDPPEEACSLACSPQPREGAREGPGPWRRALSRLRNRRGSPAEPHRRGDCGLNGARAAQAKGAAPEAGNMQAGPGLRPQRARQAHPSPSGGQAFEAPLHTGSLWARPERERERALWRSTQPPPPPDSTRQGRACSPASGPQAKTGGAAMALTASLWPRPPLAGGGVAHCP